MISATLLFAISALVGGVSSAQDLPPHWPPDSEDSKTCNRSSRGRAFENGRVLLHRAAMRREAVNHDELGAKECPCIGFDDISGATQANVSTDGKTVEVSYPADLGATCQAWDADSHPSCDEDAAESWCEEKWCYVDPKKCALPIMPKESSYQPSARYQALPLYYSYATCGSKDTWTQQVPEFGVAECRCIGFDGSPGTTMATIGAKQFPYPAEIGGECKAWDAGRHPDCEGKDMPDWCEKKWCFVDPCSCTVDVPPKVSDYLGNAKFQGKPVFWSYAACGTTDTYSSKEQQDKSQGIISEVCTATRREAVKDEQLGAKECPCIGFDDISGDTQANVSTDGKTVEVSYPADLGATCQAWDADSHPSCDEDATESWCEEKWCYVDPKKCALPVMPKESSYQPSARYQALPLYYSYATCGSKDTWTQEVPEVGVAECRCIGFDGSPGTTMATIRAKQFPYPAEIGGECKAWDAGRHPDCEGKDMPDWCEKKWCFVDPCSCTVDVPPKVSDYLGNATFQGKPVFWSYAACGTTDTYSSKEQQDKSQGIISEVCTATRREAVKNAQQSEASAPQSAGVDSQKSGSCAIKDLMVLILAVAMCLV